MRRASWGPLCIGFAVITVLLSGCILMFGGKADAAPVRHCHAAGVLSSEDVTACRQAGWIIRHNLMVAPDGRAWTNAPACRSEDDDRVCYWDAMHQGNHLGHGFVALPGRTLYVDKVNGKRVTRDRFYYWFMQPNGV